MGFHEALDDKDRAVTRADNEVCESNIAYYDAATSSEFNLEFNIASAFTGFTKLYIQTLAKIVFLGCVTRPHTQRRVTQPMKSIFADLCTNSGRSSNMQRRERLSPLDGIRRKVSGLDVGVKEGTKVKRTEGRTKM